MFPIILAALQMDAHALESDLTPMELCAAADHIVLAQVSSRQVLWGNDGWIYTKTTFHRLWNFIGDPGETFTLLMPGGELDGHHLWVSDSPDFAPGHRYVLPLTDGPGAGQHLTWAAGVVRADGLPLETTRLSTMEVCNGY